MKKNFSKKSFKGLGSLIVFLVGASVLVSGAAFFYFVQIGSPGNTTVYSALQYSVDEGVTWLDCGDIDLTLTYEDFPGGSNSIDVMFKWLGDDAITITPTVVDDIPNGVYGKIYENTNEITSFDLIPEDIDTRTITFKILVDQLTQPGTYTTTFTIDNWVENGGG